MEKDYGTMANTMVLSENYWTSIYKGTKHERLAKTKKLLFIREKSMVI